MKLYTPSYYNPFRCIASACPDSCCKDWAVDVDPEAAARYLTLPGELGDRLRAVLRDDGDGAYMEIENGRCPMWREDGLCRIQAALDHDALCHVCRTFPRLRHDYGDFAELGLELSCPEAARLILSGPWDTLCTETSGGEEADYEPDIMDILLHSRREALALTADPSLSVPELLAVLLLYAHEVQAQLDGAEALPFSAAQALADARRYAQQGDLAALLGFFQNLEILTDTWSQRLADALSCHCEGDRVSGGGIALNDHDSPWSDTYRLLIRYFLERYWLQAVSDYDLVCRVKLTLAACLVIHALGGDLTQTAQAFSKEIENDPDNVETILDGAYTSPALTDVNLLSLLLT